MSGIFHFNHLLTVENLLETMAWVVTVLVYASFFKRYAVSRLPVFARIFFPFPTIWAPGTGYFKNATVAG